MILKSFIIKRLALGYHNIFLTGTKVKEIKVYEVDENRQYKIEEAVEILDNYQKKLMFEGFGIWKSLLDFMEVLEVTMVHDYSRIVNNKKILEISGYLGDYKQNSTAFNSRYNFSPGGISPNCKNEIMFNKNDLLANETTEKYRDLVIKEEYIDEPGRLISLSNIEYEGKNENAQEILTDNNTMKQICINEDKDKDILSPGVNSIFSTNLLKSVSHSYEKENEISYNESSRENGESGRDTKTNTASQNRQKSKTQRSMEFATKK